MKNYKKLLMTAVSSVFITSLAFAATDGTEGATSTGTADLSVEIEKIVKITDVDDLTLNNYVGGAGGFDLSDDVCIYSNMEASGKYTVRVNGGINPSSGATAGYRVGNATTNDEVTFTVAWNDEDTTVGEAAVTHNTNLTTQDGFSNSLTCGGTPNANFHVVMSQANLLAVNPGTYTNTITILITPE